MDNVWRYSIEDEIGGIAIANTEEEVRTKIKESYLRHRNLIVREEFLIVWKAVHDDDWFEDDLAVLECY